MWLQPTYFRQKNHTKHFDFFIQNRFNKSSRLNFKEVRNNSQKIQTVFDIVYY